MTMEPLAGWRFKPSDDELLECFLRKKILGLPLSYHMIVEADVYSDDPKSIIDRYHTPNRDREWYFFTSTARKHPDATDSNRASRSAGAGRWKAQHSKTVLDSDHNVLGFKQSFCYMKRCPSGRETKSIWLMEEYSIHDLRGKANAPTISGSNKLDEWVICKIHLTPKARKEDLHEIQQIERAALEPAEKRRRMEEPQTIPDDALPQPIDVSGKSIDGYSPAQHANKEPSIPGQDITDSFQIHQLANETLPYPDPTVSVLGETMSSPCMHPGQNITGHCQIPQLLDDAPPKLNYMPGTSINVCSPTQHDGEELSIINQYITDSFQTHQLADDILPSFGLATLFPMKIMSSPCMHPSQGIASLDQTFKLLDNDLPQLNNVFGTSIDGCSPKQRVSKEPSILSQDIADSFQIHQLANKVLPKSSLAVPVLVEMMDDPEHVSGQVYLDQNMKDIDAKGSSIAFSPKIMQASDEESKEIAAELGSFHHDPSMPSIDDIL